MMDRRHRVVAWLGFLLAGSLAIAGSASAVAVSGSRHCDETAPATVSHAAAHQLPASPACAPSGPCAQCGALPCSAAMSCVAVSILPPAEAGALPAPGPANAGGGLRYSMAIPARSTIPPPPPPILLL